MVPGSTAGIHSTLHYGIDLQKIPLDSPALYSYINSYDHFDGRRALYLCRSAAV